MFSCWLAVVSVQTALPIAQCSSPPSSLSLSTSISTPWCLTSHCLHLSGLLCFLICIPLAFLRQFSQILCTSISSVAHSSRLAMSAPLPPVPPQHNIDNAILDIKAKHASPAQLRAAKRDGLVYIAKLVNTAANCKRNDPKIKLAGTVQELRDRVASFLEVDLSAPTTSGNSATSILPTHEETQVHAGINQDIRKIQWGKLREGGLKMLNDTAQGRGDTLNLTGACHIFLPFCLQYS